MSLSSWRWSALQFVEEEQPVNRGEGQSFSFAPRKFESSYNKRGMSFRPLLLLLLLLLLRPSSCAWQSISSPVSTVDWVGCSWSSALNGVMVGSRFEYGKIIYTKNGGLTWTDTGSTYSPLYDVSSSTPTGSSTTYYIAVAYTGDNYVSTDLGVTWSQGTAVSSASLLAVSIGSSGTAFAVGLTSTYTSGVYLSDASSSYKRWTTCTVPSGATASLNGVSTYDGKSVIAVGSSGTIYVGTFTSSNGAISFTTWFSCPTSCSGVDTDLYGISSASTQVAIVVGVEGVALKTVNGGTSWTALSSSYLTSSIDLTYHSVSMVTTSLAYITGSSGLIIKTTDAGSTWTYDQGYTGADGQTLYCIYMYSELIGAAGGARPTTGSSALVYVRTPDPTSAPTPAPSNVPSPAPSAAPTTAATISAGVWSTVSTGASSIFGAAWLSSSTCVMVGLATRTSAGILISTNKGASWSTVTKTSARGSSVAMIMRDVASATISSTTYTVVVASTGDVFYSSDSSASSFTRLSSALSANLYGVSIGSNGYAFAVGNGLGLTSGAVFKSTQSSSYATWTDSYSSSSAITTGGILYAVSSYNGVNVLAVGASGTIVYSSNSGSTWTLASSGTTANLWAVSAASASIAMAAGESGKVLLTTNSGAMWSTLTVSQVSSSSMNSHSLVMTSAMTAFLGANNGYIVATTNQGQTWSTQKSLGSTALLYPIAIYATDQGVAGDSSGNAYVLSAASSPTSRPTGQPSNRPTDRPSSPPSPKPTSPTPSPSPQPSPNPTAGPSPSPSEPPSPQPSPNPTPSPSIKPSGHPTGKPSMRPSRQPTSQPSGRPTRQPTSKPTKLYTPFPSSRPTGRPSGRPSDKPSRQPTSQPSQRPTDHPSSRPSRQPTSRPTSKTRAPTAPTGQPSGHPSKQPSSRPSRLPSSQPSRQPSRQPSTQPSRQPSVQPSGQPSAQPNQRPSSHPSGQPTRSPERPSGQPSGQPTVAPSRVYQIYMSFNVSQQLNGITAVNFHADANAVKAMQVAVAASISPLLSYRAVSINPLSGLPTSFPSPSPTRSPTPRPSAAPSLVPTPRPTPVPSPAPSAPHVRNLKTTRRRRLLFTDEHLDFWSPSTTLTISSTSRLLPSSYAELTYTVGYMVESLGYSTASAAYNASSFALVKAVKNGNFTKALAKAATAASATVLSGVSSATTITLSKYVEITYHTSYAPTHAPTPVPSFRHTPAPTRYYIGSLTLQQFEAVVCLMISLFFLAVAIFFYCRCRNASNRSKYREAMLKTKDTSEEREKRSWLSCCYRWWCCCCICFCRWCCKKKPKPGDEDYVEYEEEPPIEYPVHSCWFRWCCCCCISCWRCCCRCIKRPFRKRKRVEKAQEDEADQGTGEVVYAGATAWGKAKRNSDASVKGQTMERGKVRGGKIKIIEVKSPEEEAAEREREEKSKSKGWFGGFFGGGGGDAAAAQKDESIALGGVGVGIGIGGTALSASLVEEQVGHVKWESLASKARAARSDISNSLGATLVGAGDGDQGDVEAPIPKNKKGGRLGRREDHNNLDVAREGEEGGTSPILNATDLFRNSNSIVRKKEAKVQEQSAPLLPGPGDEGFVSFRDNLRMLEAHRKTKTKEEGGAGRPSSLIASRSKSPSPASKYNVKATAINKASGGNFLDDDDFMAL